MKFIPAVLSVAALGAPVMADVKCGGRKYTTDSIERAAAAACYSRGLPGSDNNEYPKIYDNAEGFQFKGFSSPYTIFPITGYQIFTQDQKPGNDRVVINGACRTVGLISWNGSKYIGCSGTS